MRAAPITLATVGPKGVDLLAFFYKARRGWRALTGRASYMKQERSLFYKTIWGEAATALGATVLDFGGSLLEIRAGSGSLRVAENYTSLDDPVTLRIAGNKPLVHRLLREQGLPVPTHCVCGFADFRSASEFIGGMDGSFVVKPARHTGAGDGVTAGIRGTKGLARAMALAGAYCDQVVIEKQVEGDNYRLLYLDGELLDAVLRWPPGVTGDGSSNLRRLIAKENRRRRDQGFEASQSLIDIDWELKQTVKRQGLRLRSVLHAGERIKLKSVVSDNCRDENEGVMERVCRSVVRSGSMAATAIGVRLAGVDIVTPDPLVPLEESGGAIIEVNTTPGLYYHYMTRTNSTPVANAILKRVIPAAQSRPLPADMDYTL